MERLLTNIFFFNLGVIIIIPIVTELWETNFFEEIFNNVAFIQWKIKISLLTDSVVYCWFECFKMQIKKIKKQQGREIWTWKEARQSYCLQKE